MSTYMPSEAEVEAAREAYWPAYSEAVRNAPSNCNGKGITSGDGEAAGRAGMAAAIAAARTVAPHEDERERWQTAADEVAEHFRSVGSNISETQVKLVVSEMWKHRDALTTTPATEDRNRA